jgi:iron complex outermembrane receptor protein
MPGAPEWKGSVSANWEPSLSERYKMRIGGEYTFNSLIYYGSAEDRVVSNLDGYGLFNARLGFMPQDEQWQLSVWARNIGDKVYVVNSLDQRSFGYAPYYLGERRTYGIDLSYRF